MAKTMLSKAASADMMLANGKYYLVDRVDCDEEVIFVHDMSGQDFIIDLHMISLSNDVHFYLLDELK